MPNPTTNNSAGGVPNLVGMMRDITSGKNNPFVPQKQVVPTTVKEQPAPKDPEAVKPEPVKSEVEATKPAPVKPEVETVKPVEAKPKSRRRKSAKVANSDKSKEPDHYTWQRFGFECDKAIVAKIRSIAKKEGFTNRSVMEKFLTMGIESYEAKHGVAESTKKSIDDLL